MIVGNDTDSLLRLDSQGKIVWAKQFTGLHASAAFESQDESILVIGVSRIARLDPGGDPISWTEYLHPPDSPLIPAPPFFRIDSLHEKADGTVIAAGDFGEILTLDAQGGLVSLRLPNGPTGFGRVSWVGEHAIWHGGWSKEPLDANWVERRGTDGLSWRRKIAAGQNVFVANRPHFLLGTRDGGALFGSYRRVYETDDEAKLWLVRFDQSGEVRWQSAYDVGPGEVNAHEVRDGGFVIAGWGRYYFQDTPSELEGYLWLARLGASGEVQWSKIYGNGRALPLVRELHENADGAIFLSGDFGTFDGGRITRHPDMVVMKIGADGELPGCDLMQARPLAPPKATQHDIVELHAETIQTLEPEVETEQVKRSPFLYEFEVKLIQACVSIRPAPTPVTALAGEKTWIVGGNGVVLGSFDENGWMPADVTSSMPEPGTAFRVYLPRADYVGETERSGTSFAELPGCVQIELSRDFTGVPTLGLSGGWQVLPEAPLWGSVDNEFYIAAMRDHLESRGLSGPTIRLIDHVRMDFERDGTEEVLTSARFSGASAGSPMEGSLVLLRRVVGNAVETFELLSTAAPASGSLSRYRIFGLFDLNGDGDVEIVIEGHVDGRPGTWVFDVDADGPAEVLSVGCGLQEWSEYSD